MLKFKPVPKDRKPRGQLNVDVGDDRRKRLRKYCKVKGISLVDCLKQMVDHCLPGTRGKRK